MFVSLHLPIHSYSTQLPHSFHLAPLGRTFEAIRWAPSATNAQPVRLFVLPKSRSSQTLSSLDDRVVIHFFTKGPTMFGIDCGIAMEHLQYVAGEQFNRKGRFVVIKPGKEEDGVAYPEIPSKLSTEKLLYWATWIEN